MAFSFLTLFWPKGGRVHFVAFQLSGDFVLQGPGSVDHGGGQLG